MNRHELKDRLKCVKKSTWVYFIVMTLFVVLGIALGITAMYLSGYTLSTWFAKFYPWFIVGVGLLIVVVFSVILYKYRKRR